MVFSKYKLESLELIKSLRMIKQIYMYSHISFVLIQKKQKLTMLKALRSAKSKLVFRFYSFLNVLFKTQLLGDPLIPFRRNKAKLACGSDRALSYAYRISWVPHLRSTGHRRAFHLPEYPENRVYDSIYYNSDFTKSVVNKNKL